ncbi:cation-translocating P-type ATPase [Amycolatopsis alkalitolerans]|uniref:HAD-IC family P-type ATPase n=1 Tax=Amycolatopsis alkalitolerans TaxID=2547244 RepID=A0A5C4M0S8_9PSEU|nr:HAD-IC family P-type ATPase [Amycolatopsis alkalitolerans]TNC24823.1 HAD-IC family P-type ATPase [Amycolatopsis alkalitolerans]
MQTADAPAGFHTLPAAAAAKRLDTDPATGLTSAEARDRLDRYGPNTLKALPGPGVLSRLVSQVRDPLVYVLLAAGVVTAAFGGYLDAAVIAGVVALNAVIGYVQESRAQRALDALARMVRTEATVVRDGVAGRLPADDLVPGDVVELAAGDQVPADVRLVEVHLLEVDESALTGESVPAGKHLGELESGTAVADRTNMAYSGTMVTRGSARALVTETGTATQLGAVQRMVATAGTVATPLTRKLARFSKQLSIGIVVIAAVAFVVGVARGMGVAEMFTAAVALAVGAIPEGLPAAVSIVLAIGVVRMSRRRSVVRHLPAVETLGSTTVICTDKTGTLTLNRMTVTEVAAGGRTVAATDLPEEADPALRECARAGILCSEADLSFVDGRWTGHGDPTETALVPVAELAGLDPGALRAQAPRVELLPFESERRLMATAHAGGAAYAKGAVEEILARCDRELRADGSEGSLDVERAHRVQRTFAAQGLRVLAFARFTRGASLPDEVDRGGWTLLGFQAMQDPPRPEAIRAIAACRSAGIAVKMITGDHADTARAIGKAVGLAEEPVVLTGAQLDNLDDDRLDEAAAATTVFARVSPGQKLRLVRAFQRAGQIVAMTGDGVNDAPALRRADIGVAMGLGGTDAARHAADMVLTGDDFAAIESAVEEGRGVFDNLRKFLAWTLPTNIGEGMVVLVAVVLGATLPIVPVQILWINMTTAVFLGLTMAFEPREPGIMTRPPRPPDRPLFTADLLRRVGLISLLLVVSAFIAYQWELNTGAPVAQARTVAINLFVSVQIGYLVSCRSLEHPVIRAWPRGNRMFGLGIGITAGLQLLLTYLPGMNTIFHTAPIGGDAWLRILGATVLAFVLVELDKVVWGRIRRHKVPGTGDRQPQPGRGDRA